MLSRSQQLNSAGRKMMLMLMLPRTLSTANQVFPFLRPQHLFSPPHLTRYTWASRNIYPCFINQKHLFYSKDGKDVAQSRPPYLTWAGDVFSPTEEQTLTFLQPPASSGCEHLLMVSDVQCHQVSQLHTEVNFCSSALQPGRCKHTRVIGN